MNRTYTLSASGVDRNQQRLCVTSPEVLGDYWNREFNSLEEAREACQQAQEDAEESFPLAQIRVSVD